MLKDCCFEDLRAGGQRIAHDRLFGRHFESVAISGQIRDLRIVDNQFVHKGDIL
ncbi:biotin/lipoyl-binding protein [Bradyrhizobium sp. CCGB12]|uniref:biotin/lipoyl-binding protein n=1 Tax=Bradyrhizobium sp. CCGB12 TaxID=2949632 RepID=UPI0035C0C6F8